MGIKNLPRARTTIDIVGPICGVIQLVSLQWSFYGVAARRFLAKQRRNLFDQQQIPSHVVHVLRHNLLGELHLLRKHGDNGEK